MEIKVQETKKACESKVLCAATEEEWTEAKDQALKELARNVTVKGFRKGKAPLAQAAKYINNSALLDRAGNKLVSKAYEKIVNEEKIIPVMQPSVEVKEFSDKKFTVEFTIITSPVVELGEYKGLEIKKNEVNLTEEDVQKELESLRERSAEMVVVEDDVAASDGDLVVIDFVGYIDDVAFEGGSAENYELTLGSKVFIPGFEDQVIGMKVGEEKEINVTFPEDYGAKELAGKPVVFKVKVNEIKEKIKRELDKDFFEDLGMEGVDSEESLKKEIKASIKAQKEADNENKYVDEILEKVSKNVEVDIPQGMVDEEVTRLMGRFEEQIKMQGISLDLYYQFTKTTEEDLKNQLEKEAYSNVLYRLMLEEIMNLEKIEVTAKEAEKEAEELAKKYQMKKEEFLAQFGGLDMIQYDLEMRKTVELLKELNK